MFWKKEQRVVNLAKLWDAVHVRTNRLQIPSLPDIVKSKVNFQIQ